LYLYEKSKISVKKKYTIEQNGMYLMQQYKLAIQLIFKDQNLNNSNSCDELKHKKVIRVKYKN